MQKIQRHVPENFEIVMLQSQRIEVMSMDSPKSRMRLNTGISICEETVSQDSKMDIEEKMYSRQISKLKRMYGFTKKPIVSKKLTRPREVFDNTSFKLLPRVPQYVFVSLTQPLALHFTYPENNDLQVFLSTATKFPANNNHEYHKSEPTIMVINSDKRFLYMGFFSETGISFALNVVRRKRK